MRLLDLTEFIVDCPHSTAFDEGEGIALIRTPNIGAGYFILDNVHRVSESVYEERIKRGKPQKNDLVYAREAPAGNVAIIKDEIICLGQRTVLIRPDSKKVNPLYLMYYLLSESKKNQLLSKAHGSTVSHVNMKEIRELNVDDILPLDIQEKIASILSNYDDLIENNKKRIKCLEETISLLFKKWFVYAKKEGWENRRLEEIIYQKKSKLNNWSDIDIVDLSSMPSFSMTIQSYSNPEDFTTNIFKLDKMDLLFGAIRPYLGKAGFAPKDCAVAGTVLHFQVKNEIYYYYTLALITSKFFFDYANCVASGTKMPVIKFEDLCRYTIIIPADKELFLSFNRIMAPMVEELNRLSVLNASLAHQRSLLLPRLMSGKLSI